jgi:hypothetical protein
VIESGKAGALERNARTAEELRAYADARFKLEKERHEIEEALWKEEDAVTDIVKKEEETEKVLTEARRKVIDIERRIKQLPH